MPRLKLTPEQLAERRRQRAQDEVRIARVLLEYAEAKAAGASARELQELRKRQSQTAGSRLRHEMAPPPGTPPQRLHIVCRNCDHMADMLLPAARIARGVTLRCSQCGAKRKL